MKKRLYSVREPNYVRPAVRSCRLTRAISRNYSRREKGSAKSNFSS